MNEPRPQSEDQCFIGGFGLARMAWHLAGERRHDYGPGFTMVWSPVCREMAEGNPRQNPVSAEYYRIIDRLARGETP